MKRLLLILIIGVVLLPSCSAADRAEGTLFFEEVDADYYTLGGAPLLIPAYGEIYNTAHLTVECYAADTYYLVSGNTTTGEILGFEDSGLGRLTYTDITPNRICLITTGMTIGVPVEDRPAIISAKMYLNGVADDASFIGEYISDADPAGALPIMCLTELSNTGDYIEIYIASNADNTTVVVYTMTLVATTVD